jgi:hypothetical protein
MLLIVEPDSVAWNGNGGRSFSIGVDCEYCPLSRGGGGGEIRVVLASLGFEATFFWSVPGDSSFSLVLSEMVPWLGKSHRHFLLIAFFWNQIFHPP